MVTVPDSDAPPFEILRPDDLVTLHVTAINLGLDRSTPGKPKLVRRDSAQPATLVFHFAPQSIVESAYAQQDDGTFVAPGPAAVGAVPARMAGASRLAFRLPADMVAIDYSRAALLDWSRLEPVLPAAAMVADGTVPPTAPPIAPPGPAETAVELPYRLMLAPAVLPDGDRPGWRHAVAPVDHGGRVELWHTRLARVRPAKSGRSATVSETRAGVTLPVRAVWSPDFVTGGPLPDPGFNEPPPPTATNASDRDQIVILTSGFAGYRRSDSSGEHDFAPKAASATKLYLSALGGWLSADATWPGGVFYRWFRFPTEIDPPPRLTVTVPPPVRLIPDQDSDPGAPPPDRDGVFGPGAVAPVAIDTNPIAVRPGDGMLVAPLDLTGWNHVATAGRDHEVKLVYEGFLFPFGHRAALIKLTERIFRTPVTGGESSPVAYLRQKEFIVVRERDKDYDPAAFAHHGREMPFRHVHLHTGMTPAIDPTPKIGGTASFWIDVDSAPFGFSTAATDLAGHISDFPAAMIFVDARDTSIDAVVAAYAADTARRQCPTNGHHVAFLDPNAGDTVFKANALYFQGQKLPLPLPWIDPPFLPVLDQASVVVRTLHSLLGQTSPVVIGWYPSYLDHDLDAHAGVFALITAGVKEVAFTADKAGGFATPNLTLSALSTVKGLVAGDPDEAAAGTMKPSEFFGAVDAKLFGTVPLGGLIPLDTVTGTADASTNAPVIRTVHLPDATNPVASVTHLIWKPELADYAKDPVKVEFNQDGTPSVLSLDVAVTRPFDGSAPTLKAEGKLTKFRLSLLGVVALKVDALDFVSNNHAKTTVTAHLAATDAIVFEGPLAFIQTLATIMPSDMFGGSGLSIKMTPTALKVSYTLGFPPITVGVFSLQNIAITAGLILPWLDGKPGFEFYFASRAKPFLVTVEIFGGGGFVGVVLDADGVQMVEGAIEFGGNFAFDVGVASGGVHVMAGIYFQLKGPDSDLTGFIDIGGEVSVLGIISISIDLNLSLSWVSKQVALPGGTGTKKDEYIIGKATLSVSIHIIFFSVSVSVSVEKRLNVGGGDPQVWQLMSGDDWHDYAAAFA